jgi:tetratricopeptide (TPR) repeat protein
MKIKKTIELIALSSLFLLLSKRDLGYQEAKTKLCCQTYEMDDTTGCKKLYASHRIPHVPSLYALTMEGKEEIKPRNKIEELIIKAVEAEKVGNFKKALKYIDKAIEKYDKCFCRDGWKFERYYLNLLELKTRYQIKLGKLKRAKKTLDEASEVLQVFLEKNKNEEGWKAEYLESERQIWEELREEIEAKNKNKF